MTEDPETDYILHLNDKILNGKAWEKGPALASKYIDPFQNRIAKEHCETFDETFAFLYSTIAITADKIVMLMQHGMPEKDIKKHLQNALDEVVKSSTKELNQGSGLSKNSYTWRFLSQSALNPKTNGEKE